MCAFTLVAGLCRKSQKENKRCKLFQGSNDRITIENLKHPNFDGNQGIVQISMELMPMSIAAQIPAVYPPPPPFLLSPTRASCCLLPCAPLDVLSLYCVYCVYDLCPSLVVRFKLKTGVVMNHLDA